MEDERDGWGKAHDHEKIKLDLQRYLADLRTEMELIKSNIRVLRLQHSSIGETDDRMVRCIEQDEEQLDTVIDKINAQTVHAAEMGNLFLKLPDELMLEIFKWLPNKYMYKMPEVSKRWKGLMSSTTMINHEKKVRWTSDESVLVLKNTLEYETQSNRMINMRQYDGKIYCLEREHRSYKSQILCDHSMYQVDRPGYILNGTYTVHEDVVYYVLVRKTPTDDRNIIGSYRFSDQAPEEVALDGCGPDGITSLVVAGDHLYAVSYKYLHIFTLSLGAVHMQALGSPVTTLVADGKDVIIYGRSRNNASTTTYRFSYESGFVTSQRIVTTLPVLVAGHSCRLMAMACSDTNEVYSYFETRKITEGDTKCYYGIILRNGGGTASYVFRTECDENESRREGMRNMGITGHYVYVSTSYKDFVIMDTRTMRPMVPSTSTIVRDIVIAPDSSLYILGVFSDGGNDRVLRFHWDL
jgi:hypothetical protein